LNHIINSELFRAFFKVALGRPSYLSSQTKFQKFLFLQGFKLSACKIIFVIEQHKVSEILGITENRIENIYRKIGGVSQAYRVQISSECK